MKHESLPKSLSFYANTKFMDNLWIMVSHFFSTASFDFIVAFPDDIHHGGGFHKKESHLGTPSLAFNININKFMSLRKPRKGQSCQKFSFIFN